jgi:hypothetical protein
MIEDLRLNKDYRREPGIHRFTLSDNTPVTAIAEPSWERFQEAFSTLPATSGYIISPELITSPLALNETRASKAEIQAKVDIVRELSSEHPDAHILLGSASFDDEDTMRNSLHVIVDGHIRGFIDKRGIMWPVEGREFSRKLRLQSELKSIGHSALVCSDLITALSFGLGERVPKKDEYISPAAETLLVSSCWAVPQYDHLNTPRSGDERFLGPLERTITGIFQGYPNLKEVVMVDRAMPISETSPYTAHFKREQADLSSADV